MGNFCIVALKWLYFDQNCHFMLSEGIVKWNVCHVWLICALQRWCKKTLAALMADSAARIMHAVPWSQLQYIQTDKNKDISSDLGCCWVCSYMMKRVGSTKKNFALCHLLYFTPLSGVLAITSTLRPGFRNLRFQREWGLLSCTQLAEQSQKSSNFIQKMLNVKRALEKLVKKSIRTWMFSDFCVLVHCVKWIKFAINARSFHIHD